MVKSKHIIIVVFALVVGIIAYYVFFQSEEAKIKRQFKRIAEKIEKTPEESIIVSATKANRISEAFTKSCTVQAPEYAFSKQISSGELSTHILSLRSQYSEIFVKLYDFVIDFPEKGNARVAMTASMQGKLTTGESTSDLHELKCKLRKTEDTWLIEEVEFVEVLKK
jgi:hypothetical protein